jgi:hypothetical protein
MYDNITLFYRSLIWIIIESLKIGKSLVKTEEVNSRQLTVYSKKGTNRSGEQDTKLLHKQTVPQEQ